MLFPYSRPILGPSFGPNGWNGTRTNDVFLLTLAAARVLGHGRGRIIPCRLLCGDGIRTLRLFGVAGNGRLRCRRGLSGNNGNSGASRETSANAGRKPAENCVLPQMKEQTGRRWAIG